MSTKAPRARVNVEYRLKARSDHKTNVLYSNYSAVIPAPTAAKARQIVKAAPFLNMTEGAQVEAIAKELNRRASSKEFGPFFMEQDRKHARLFLAVLAAINGGGR